MISRCLVPFAFEIAAKPIAQWADVWRALPRECPHADCTARCRDICGEYAKTQKAVLSAHIAREASA